MPEIVKHMPHPDAGVIERLEDLLKDAKAGELQGFCLAGINAFGETYLVRVGFMYPYHMAGALEAAKMQVLAGFSDAVRDVLELEDN